MGDEEGVSEELARAYRAAYERVFTARDVLETSGLTSRQLNDWDERGALPHDRESEVGWRRFSARDVFVLMTCAELRRQFGVSVERIKYVQNFMLQEDADHLRAAIDLMAAFGVGVWLLTDFKETFVMDSELEFESLWGMGYFGGEGPCAYALLKMNPIVNQLLACRKDPISIPNHGRGYEMVNGARSASTVRTPEEFEALQLIRSGEYERVEVVAPDGNIETIYTTARPDPTADLDEICRKHPYQRLIITQKDGKTISIEQQAVIKPSNGRKKQ